MNVDVVFESLGLPDRALVDRRVPKKLLREHGARSATDRRYINDDVEEIRWVASLRPDTVAVPALIDEERDYSELAVLKYAMRNEAHRQRLLELLHRAIPYPIMVIATRIEEGAGWVSLAHKRQARDGGDRRVLDGVVVSSRLPNEAAPAAAAFRDALSLGRQPQTSLFSVYEGWIQAVVALEASHLTGAFSLLLTTATQAARREALMALGPLEAKIRQLRRQLAKERQVARRVELNVELKRAISERESRYKAL